jgi:hypothetical protein
MPIKKSRKTQKSKSRPSGRTGRTGRKSSTARKIVRRSTALERQLTSIPKKLLKDLKL